MMFFIYCLFGLVALFDSTICLGIHRNSFLCGVCTVSLCLCGFSVFFPPSACCKSVLHLGHVRPVSRLQEAMLCYSTYIYLIAKYLINQILYLNESCSVSGCLFANCTVAKNPVSDGQCSFLLYSVLVQLRENTGY